MRNNILLLCLVLVGCGTKPVIDTVIQRVEIPVSIPCKAVIPTTPIYYFDKLDTNSDIYDKTKALLADKKLHLGYETELLAALTSCVK